MLSTRNLRFLFSALAIFGIVAFFATSQNSLGNPIQRGKPASPGSIALQNEVDNVNTLQGTPHQGNEPPYSQKESPKAGSSNGHVVADKGKAVTPDDSDDSDDVPVLDDAPGKSTKPGKPKIAVDAKCNDVDYVVMIDAGSTGSRVHVYSFNTCVSPPKLLAEKFEMLKPGLSSFDTDTKGAAASLDPLLKVALDTVPEAKRSCTPVAVKATAGLRLLGKEKSDNILAEVRSHLENDYPFAVVPGDGISIMEGRDEGVYAWITTNYLLGNIGSSEKIPTAAVFDLGGGSTQIVFEPEFGNNEEMVEGEHKYKFSFGDRDFTLYQFSHLGYGLMQGRNKINALVVQGSFTENKALASSKLNSKAETKGATAAVTINNPCIPPGVIAKDVVVEVGENEFYVVNMKGPSSAAGAQCRFLAEKVLNKDAECAEKPCSFNGVHQPSLTKAFKRTSDMYVFSYFYDRTNPLGFPSSFTVEELTELAKVVCDGSSLWQEVLLDEHVKELNEEPHWCTDLSFITAMLHTGYDIPLSRELRTAKTIDNNELGWCLGASLPLLDKKNSGWKCKVSRED
ncbi:golgi guanosine diphosphatase [Scheffersomyces xylosifermentans]|uniref:golgi guanosine diphosphatase n=1 Tax=Scheffersomyces xylosifermentans TaxID=1304137 RepID=UPI00315D1800